MYAYAWLILDLFAVLVLLYTVYRCAEKGFLRTIINLLGYLAAAFAAGTLSAPMAKLLYDKVVRDALRIFLERRLENALEAPGMDAAGSLLGAVPKTLLRIMQGTGRELLGAAFDGDVAAMAETVVDAALQDPVMSILRGISFFVVFWLAMLLVRRFSWLFSGIYKIPVLGSLNTVLGGIVGVAEAVILLYIIGIGLQLIVYATGGELPFLNRQVLDSTYVYRVFFNLS